MSKKWVQDVTKKMKGKGTKRAPKTGGPAAKGTLESAAKKSGALGKRAQYATNAKKKP
tara:strand:+ start:832 stop:1005 length:174 start_codon:yes stop_codon:yes gene_type:complete